MTPTERPDQHPPAPEPSEGERPDTKQSDPAQFDVDIPDDDIPSGYQKVETHQGVKIVREGPVSFVRRELAMSPRRQQLWRTHQGSTILPVTRTFADTSVAPESYLDSE